MKTNANDFVDLNGNGSPASPTRGLTKREYFAGLAMQGLLAGKEGELIINCDRNYFDHIVEALSRTSVEYADALIEQLNKEEK